MMRRAITITLVTVLMSLGVTGCSDKGEDFIEPSPLPSFERLLVVEKTWSLRVGKGVDGGHHLLRPGLSEDRSVVAVADSLGQLVLLDVRSGKPIWKKKSETEVTGSPVVGADKVVIGSADGLVVAYATADGAEVWRTQASSEILSQPVMADGLVVVQTSDGRLSAFDATDGRRRWVYDTLVPPLSLRGAAAPQISGGLVLAGFANGKLVALDLRSGSPRWERQVAVPEGRSELDRLVDLDGMFAVAGERVYAVSYQGRVVALDINTGLEYWELKASSISGLTERDGRVFVSTDDSRLLALDARSGQLLWEVESLRGRGIGAPAAVGDVLAVGDFEGYLHWFRQADGVIVARHRVGRAALRGAPQVIDRQIIVQGDAGAVGAFLLKSDS